MMARSAEAWEIVRVEVVSPAFGWDITVEKLPEEMDMDARAIGFDNGCHAAPEPKSRKPETQASDVTYRLACA